MQQSNYNKELAQKIKATPQEMDAWEALRREPGLTGRLARRGKNMKRSYVGGKRSFQPPGRGSGTKKESQEFAKAGGGRPEGHGNGGSTPPPESGGGGQTAAQKAAAAAAAAAAAKVAAEKAAEEKKKADAKEKVKTDRSARRKGLVEGVMKDAEGRVEGDKGVMTDTEGRVEGDEGYDKETAELKGGYDESTGKLDTEGSLEGIRQDYKGLREEADYSETREDLEGYQSEADRLKTEAAGKYAGYESDIAGQPDYASKVAELAAAQAGTGTKAQQDLAALGAEIDTSTTEGKKALKDAAGEMGIAAGDIKDYESKVGEFAKAGQTAATEAATGIKAAAGRGETAAQTGAAGIQAAAGRGEAAAGRGEAAAGQGQANLAAATAAQQQAAQTAAAGVTGAATAGQAGITGAAGAGQAGITAAGGQGMTQAQQAQQAMGAASSRLGGMADTAMDTGALMKDRGLFAGQIEAKSKAAQQGKLGNLRRSMAASGASPAEIARAEAEASGGAQSGREDALAASMAAMQSGQSQLGQAAGLTGQQAQIAAQGGQLGLAGAGQGLQAAQAAGQMGMTGAQAAGQMGMQGAQSAGQFGMAGGAAGMQGAQAGAQLGMQGAQMGMSGAQMGMQGAQSAGQMGMAGAGMGMQGAQSAGQMGMSGAQMGMAGAGQQAGMAGQRAGIAGQQGAMGMQGAQLGLAGSGQKAQNIQAGAGQAMQGQQGAMQGYGAAQGLGIGKTQAAAGMYGQGLQSQTGLMNMGASLSKDQQTSQMNEITQRGGLTGDMAGMTEAQLQDVVAKQNAAQQKDLAERGLLAQQQAAAANRPQGPSQQQQFMDFAKTAISVKAMLACIPKGITIDMASGVKVPVENINVGDSVMGLNGKPDEVLQVHQYKQDPESARFITITFDGWRKVNCSDKHRISNKRAEDYKLQDEVGNREVTSIDRYNGVSRSFDLLTATGGYRINGVPVNTMIPEMAEVITELNKTIKLAA